MVLLKQKKGTIASEDFVDFLTDLKKKLMDENKNAIDNTILIFDNARVHQSRDTKKMARQLGLICSTSIPYTPSLNACEYFINTHKKHIRKEIGLMR